MRASQVFAGDLLTALAALKLARGGDDASAVASALGFERQKTSAPLFVDLAGTGQSPRTSDPHGNKAATEPLRAEAPADEQQVFWRVASDLRQDEPRVEVPAYLHQPVDDKTADYLADPQAPRLPRHALVSRERLARFLAAYLAARSPGGQVDVERAVGRLARAEPLLPLPLASERRWPARVQVVLDRSQLLWPVHDDLSDLRNGLGALLQRRMALLRTDSGEPDDWCAAEGLQAQLALDGSPVIVLGDAGAYRQGAGVHLAWAAWARRLERNGVRPLLMAPLPADRLPIELHAAFDVVLLDHGAVLRLAGRPARKPRGVHAAAVASPAGAAVQVSPQACLRSALFGNSHVTWAQLRRLRLAMQRAGLALSIADEVELSLQAEVATTSTACALQPQSVEAARGHMVTLRGERPDLHTAIVREHWQSLQSASPLVRGPFALEWAHPELRPQSDDALAASLLAEATAQVSRMRQAARRFWRAREQGEPADQRTLTAALSGFVAAADLRSPAALGRADAEVQDAWAIANADGLASGQIQSPAGVDLQRLAWLLTPLDDAQNAGRRQPLNLTVRAVRAQPRAPAQYQLAVTPAAADAKAGPAALVRLDPYDRLPTLTEVRTVDAQCLWALDQLAACLDASSRRVSGGKPRSGKQRAADARSLLSPALGRVWPGTSATTRQRVDRLLAPITMAMGAGTPSEDLLTELRSTALEQEVLSAEFQPADQTLLQLATAIEAALRDCSFRMDDTVAREPLSKALVPGPSYPLGLRSRYIVQFDQRHLMIEPFRRPSWAQQIRFDRNRWLAVGPTGSMLTWVPAMRYTVVDGEGVKTFEVDRGAWWQAGEEFPVAHPNHAGVFKPAWATRHGVDDFGYWAEFEVESNFGHAIQHMRWIPPGEFLMGSPESEPERSNDETQHPVLLTQGYWLADTACTQALWQAVMGDNPSMFKDDPSNPVEQVSWRDITERFLPALNRLVPGLEAVLPTEAQWENACRAGTTTPFSLGDQITPEQVNYDGNYPYADGEKGPYRRKTVPVMSLLSNDWGLYEMHGNVWEWCRDGQRRYEAETAMDPVGPQDREAGLRVLRGGSWGSFGWFCRSADRNAFDPDERDVYFGFRLARGLADQQEARGVRAEPAGVLRSAERGAGAVASAGAAAPADAKVASPSRPSPRRTKR